MPQSTVPDFFELVANGHLLPQAAITAMRDCGLKGADNDLTALVRRGIAEAADSGLDFRQNETGGTLSGNPRLQVDAAQLRAGARFTGAMEAAYDLYRMGVRSHWWR